MSDISAEDCIKISYDCTWGTTDPSPEHTCTLLGGQPCVVLQRDQLQELALKADEIAIKKADYERLIKSLPATLRVIK